MEGIPGARQCPVGRYRLYRTWDPKGGRILARVRHPPGWPPLLAPHRARPRYWWTCAAGTARARSAGTLVPVMTLWLAWGDALAQTLSKPRCTRCGGEGVCCTEYPERDVEHGGTWLLDTSGRVRITGVNLAPKVSHTILAY